MAEAVSQPRLERTQEIKLPAAALAMAMNHDGSTVYAACLDGGVYSVDTAAGTSRLLGKHESYANGVVLFQKARLLVSGGYDGALVWHDLAEGRVIRTVKAHEFWSWDLSASRDGQWIASVTGQYLSGGYRYEPASEREPSVRIFDARTGELSRSLTHVPPVQAVAFSPDSRHVAAANLMGEVRVWEVGSGKEVSRWKTDDLTSWGVIKSHHFLGGVFCMQFHPDGKDLYVCGMGPMVDPMAGNGAQRWQRFDWLTGKRLDQTHEGESGQGLMEALAFHAGGKLFAMAGRLFQGKWNLALFDVDSGKILFSMDAKHRITDAQFTADGARLLLAKAKQQERKSGNWVEFGLIEVYSVQT